MAMLNINQIFGITISTCTIVAYLILFILSRRWRRDFESRGVTYWRAPKEKRLKELMIDVWNPRRIAAVHGLSYFAEGYIRTAMTLWTPFFLTQVRSISTLEASLFIGLMYAAWSWKAFIGMVSDAFPIRWKGRTYRRLPWFLASGILTTIASMPFLLLDPNQMSVWTIFFPLITAILGADAVLDLAADSYATDVTPPEYHSRLLGGVGFGGRSMGGALACVLPPLIIGIGGFQLLFLSTGCMGMLAFPCCFLLRGPKLVEERTFSKRTIAFTFSEKTIYIASITAFGLAFTPRAFCSPIGGMFALFVKNVLEVSIESVSMISLAGVLAGVPGALIGGWASDKWGHRRAHTISLSVFALTGVLWATLSTGMVWWFTFLVVITNLMLNFYIAAFNGLMPDVTPLGLSSTVLQLFFSFVWIGGFIVSPIIGVLLPISMALCVAVVSSLSLIGLISGILVKPFEAGKATQV